MKFLEVITKKERDIRAVIEKMKKISPDKLEYTAGLVDGLSIAYDAMYKKAELRNMKRLY